MAVVAAVAAVGCGAEPIEWSISPAEGSRSGGQPVSIQGRPLGPDAQPVTLTGHGPVAVYFGTRAALGVVLEGESLMRLTTPKSEDAGVVDVQLHFDDGLRITIPQGYRYSTAEGIVLTPRDRG